MALVRTTVAILLLSTGLFAQTPVGNVPSPSGFQPTQLSDASGECKACHPRQYFEMKQAVHFGYRNISPIFNGLEMAGNFLTGGLLRPVYGDSTKTLADGSPLNTNMFTTPIYKDVLQADAGFCYSCHQALMELKGEDPTQREVPEIATGLDFRPDLLRPLRDYHWIDNQAVAQQILPADPGTIPFDMDRCGGICSGSPLSTTGITCDACHSTGGPDLNRSFQHDGFGNMGMLLFQTKEKVGQFLFPVATGADSQTGDFHVASNNLNKINYLNNSAFCNACHDVRIPMALPGDLQHQEANVNPGGENVSYYRLENLSTEWQTGPYSGTNNPFGRVMICHDCHTSQFPYTPPATYQVGDMTVTAATPGQFPINFAAVPGVLSCQNDQGQYVGILCANTVSTAAAFDNAPLNTDIQYSTFGDYPLQKREVSGHYFTGVDVPLVSFDELKARLGPDSSDPSTGTTEFFDDMGNPDPGNINCDITPCFNENGVPRALAQRRIDLLQNAVRVTLRATDTTASLGSTFVVRLEAAALTGHRFPGGLSQERTAYVQLTVADDNGFVVYQSGYSVDKPHPQTGETAPDGNLADEDLENVHIVVDPGKYTAVYQPGPETNGHRNQVFEAGPDNGPEERVYFGEDEGLVLFRNELQRIFLPGEGVGRTDASGNPIVATTAHLEELVSADLNNTVDNYRSLQPLQPRTFRYNVTLPTQQELAEMGVTLQGSLHVHAQVNFEHFPPMTVRFVIRTTSPEGPSGRDNNLFTEADLDTYVKNIQNIASDDFTVKLVQ